MNEGLKNCEQSELILMDCTVKINAVPFSLARDNEDNLHLLDQGGQSVTQVEIKKSTSSDNYEGSGAVGPTRTVCMKKYLVIPARLFHPDMTGTVDVVYATHSRSYSRSTSDYGSPIGKGKCRKRNFLSGKRIKLPDGKFTKILIDANLKPGSGEIIPLLND